MSKDKYSRFSPDNPLFEINSEGGYDCDDVENVVAKLMREIDRLEQENNTLKEQIVISNQSPYQQAVIISKKYRK